MGDVGDIFDGMREESQARRARNREGSARLLKGAGFTFESRNMGAHLIVATARGTVDFWPGTGLWIPRGSRERRRGVHALMRWATR